MLNENAKTNEAEIYSPQNLQRLVSVLWNSREETTIQSVLLYVVLGAFAGLRPAEAVELEWKQIDWSTREIRLPATSGKAGRSISIKDNLMTFLLPYKGRNGSVIVHKKVANLLRNECTRAGVRHISNGLRRSYGSYRLGESSEEIVQSEMGSGSSHQPEHRAITAAEIAKYWTVRP
jgi:integrase